MSSENCLIKADKLKTYLSPNALTHKLINVRRQNQKFGLQNSHAVS